MLQNTREEVIHVASIRLIQVEKLRKSSYNPRIVQDPDRARALAASIREEGVRQPLLVWRNARENVYEVIDGWRRLRAAREAGIKQLPCVILELDEHQLKRAALSIHLTQDDLTPEELVNFIDRLVAEEEFRNIDDVCRYYGLSKEWYYSLRRAVKVRSRLDHDVSGLPVSTLSLIERSKLPTDRKQELIQALAEEPLPREAVKQIVERMEEKPTITAAEAIEEQKAHEPQKIEEGFIEAEGRLTYQIKRVGRTITITAQDPKQPSNRQQLTIPAEDLPIIRRLIQEII